MTASAADAVTRARELTQQRLFPFQLDKWTRLGFIAFLAGLGEGGYGVGAKWPGLPGSPKSSKSFDPHEMLVQIETFVREHLGWIVVGGVTLFLIGLSLGALVTWVSSRGEFIFIESVIHDRTALSEPWGRLSVPGWELFKLRFGVGVIVSVLTLLLFAGAGWLALPDFVAGRYLAGVLHSLPFIGGIVLVGVPASVFLALVRDFVVPIMYLDGLGISAGWKAFREGVLPGNTGNLLTFYLIKIGLGFGAAILTMVATCLTCCLAALPYVGTVVLLPVHVFFRAFSLAMLEELGRPVFPVVQAPAPLKGWF